MSGSTNESIAKPLRQEPRHDALMSWSGLEAFAILASALISTPFVAILIGPEQLGKSALVQGLIGVVEIICAVGLQEALVRAPSIHTKLTDSAHTLVVGVMLLAMLGLMAVAGPIARWLGDDQLRTLLITGSIAVPLGGQRSCRARSWLGSSGARHCRSAAS
jgi:O-antigen/teichoic acid export membrane protein